MAAFVKTPKPPQIKYRLHRSSDRSDAGEIFGVAERLLIARCSRKFEGRSNNSFHLKIRQRAKGRGQKAQGVRKISSFIVYAVHGCLLHKSNFTTGSTTYHSLPCLLCKKPTEIILKIGFCLLRRNLQGQIQPLGKVALQVSERWTTDIVKFCNYFA